MNELPKKDSHEVAGGVQSPLTIPGFPNPGPGGVLPPPGGCTLPFDPLKQLEK